MKKAQQTATRLQKVLLRDRMGQGPDSLAMLRADLANLLSDYFDLDRASLAVDVEPKGDGSYRLSIAATAIRMYR